MKRKVGFQFMLAAVLIGICTFLFFNEAKLGSMDIPAGIDLRQGIDLKGGIYALLYPDKENVTDEELQAAKAVIDRRLDNRNIFDRNIYVESDKKRIVVEYPSKGGADSYDINELGSIGSLTFREVVEKQVDKAGNYLPLDDMIILTGADIKSAKMEIYEGAYVVAFELYEEGAGKFAEATTRLAGVGRIGIFMDQELISAPSVDDPITEGSGIIRGSFTAKEASNLAGNIMAGALPFKMVARQVNQISPSLGENALKVTVWAGMLALLLICLFMTGYYRLPGVVASLAIMSLAVFQVDLISWAKIPLTLPGIAGIILSIGMGVDANVIIYERIKEELKNGKTISTAVDLGFKRAFSAIIDSNVTTIITGVVLYIMTTGPIKGFAVTLVLGVLLSFLTAITISRTLIRFTLGLGFGRNKWLYGGQGRA